MQFWTEAFLMGLFFILGAKREVLAKGKKLLLKYCYTK